MIYTEETLTVREIAENEGLEYIETTTEMNGYPRNLKFAITGFDTFEQAQELADKYNLSIQSFEKRDGWQLWYRTGVTMYSAFENNAETYGDNYSEECEETVCDYITDCLTSRGFDTSEKVKFLKQQLEILEEIENAEYDEIVITEYGEYYDTIKQTSMSFYHDTKHYVIGLIND